MDVVTLLQYNLQKVVIELLKIGSLFCSDHCCIHDPYHIISSNQSEKSR